MQALQSLLFRTPTDKKQFY